MYKLCMFNVKQWAKRGAGAVPILWQGVKSWKMLSVGDDDVGSLWPMTSAAGFLPPLSSPWNSAGHIVFVVFQSNLSECGSSGFYLLRLHSVQLSTSGDLLSPESPWLHFRSPSTQPPLTHRAFELRQKTALPDLFTQPPELRGDTPCLQQWPVAQWLLWLVCINTKRKTISANSLVNLTGH